MVFVLADKKHPNILLLVSDTVRADYLGCYGHPVVQTPHIDALAANSVVFENCHCSSFPTGPMRKDLLTGVYSALFSSWQDPLPDGQVTWPQLLKNLGYRTARLGDTSNVRHDFGFDEESFIFGQGGGDVADDGVYYEPPAPLDKLRTPEERIQKLLRQEASWASEEERFAPRTMRRAHAWLEEHRESDQPFFLMVDTFDPHEPWNPPRYYIDQYDPDYQGAELFEPAYSPADYATEEEIQHMRWMYAAELTMVDRWIGFLLDGLRRMQLWDDTIIIFTSDHGFYHGEHGLMGKVHLDSAGAIIGRYPLYSTITHTPLLVKGTKAGQHRRVRGLCQPVDLLPTVLDLLETAAPMSLQGVSLMSALQGGTTGRNQALSTTTLVLDSQVRCPVSYRTPEYLYIDGGDESGTELIALSDDPQENLNIAAEQPQLVADLHGKYWSWLQELKAPEFVLDARKEYPPKRREGIPYKKII